MAAQLVQEIVMSNSGGVGGGGGGYPMMQPPQLHMGGGMGYNPLQVALRFFSLSTVCTIYSFFIAEFFFFF